MFSVGEGMKEGGIGLGWRVTFLLKKAATLIRNFLRNGGWIVDEQGEKSSYMSRS